MIKPDAYFIRSKDDPDHFLHFEGDTPDAKSISYRLLKGVKGAAVWKWKKGIRFIKNAKINNAELVRVTDILEKQ